MGAAKPIVMWMKSEIAEGRIDLGSLGEIFPTDAAETVAKTMGVEGPRIFGMTEGTAMFTRIGDNAAMRYTTRSQAVSAFHVIRIPKPGTEVEIADGEIGKIAAFGPYTIRGYYDAAECDAEAFTSDRFCRTGDLMRRVWSDGRAYYPFEGRI